MHIKGKQQRKLMTLTNDSVGDVAFTSNNESQYAAIVNATNVLLP